MIFVLVVSEYFMTIYWQQNIFTSTGSYCLIEKIFETKSNISTSSILYTGWGRTNPCEKYVTVQSLIEVQNQLQPPIFVHEQFDKTIFHSVKRPEMELCWFIGGEDGLVLEIIRV